MVITPIYLHFCTWATVLGPNFGTASVRRQAQILHRRPDLKCVVFRGNVLHNGLGYPADHLQIHAYLYPPGYNHPSEVE